MSAPSHCPGPFSNVSENLAESCTQRLTALPVLMLFSMFGYPGFQAQKQPFCL